jgi:hypothetical protein
MCVWTSIKVLLLLGPLGINLQPMLITVIHPSNSHPRQSSQHMQAVTLLLRSSNKGNTCSIKSNSQMEIWHFQAQQQETLKQRQFVRGMSWR